MQFLSLHTFDQTYANTPSLRQNPLLKREALRRLAWCIFYQDTCVDAGQHGVHLLDESGFHIQLPCDEASFLRDVEVPTAFLNPTEAHADQSSVLLGRNTYDPEPHLGLSAHLIRTGNMRRRILHYRSRVRYSTESPEDMLRHMTLVERDLRQLIAQLPSDLAYTEQNLFVHASDRPAFVLLHLVRHNCFLMLALTRLNICARDPGLEERSRAFRRDRIRHALPVSNIVADILRLQVQCDPNIGAHAYTSLESEYGSKSQFEIETESKPFSGFESAPSRYVCACRPRSHPSHALRPSPPLTNRCVGRSRSGQVQRGTQTPHGPHQARSPEA